MDHLILPDHDYSLTNHLCTHVSGLGKKMLLPRVEGKAFIDHLTTVYKFLVAAIDIRVIMTYWCF